MTDYTDLILPIVRRWAGVDLGGTLQTISLKLEIIMATQDELAAALTAAADKTDKIIAEVQASTAALQAAIAAAGASTPAVDAALARLTASLTIADDLNPDTGAVVAP